MNRGDVPRGFLWARAHTALGLKTLAGKLLVFYNTNMTGHPYAFFICALTLAALPAEAQLVSAVKTLPRVSAVSAERILKQASALRTPMQVAPLLKTPPSPFLKPQVIPATIRRSVFTVQSTPSSKHKGSAFAVKIDGKVWGATARHVRDDIGTSPYMTIPGPQGEELTFPIFPAKEGCNAGVDLSLFHIPDEAQELLLPLELADELPSAHDILGSSGFAHGNFLSQPFREVLFASQHRILTRYVSFNLQESGYCGSPLMINGKVAGVHVGSLMEEQHKMADWFNETLGPLNAAVQDVSLAVPAFWLRHLARQAGEGAAAPQGVPLLFNGVEITRFQAHESINFIMQLRNGRVLKTLPRYPFMDFTHLENFFDILPGDSFRMEINPGSRSYSPRQKIWYEWNSDGTNVTQTVRR